MTLPDLGGDQLSETQAPCGPVPRHRMSNTGNEAPTACYSGSCSWRASFDAFSNVAIRASYTLRYSDPVRMAAKVFFWVSIAFVVWPVRW